MNSKLPLTGEEGISQTFRFMMFVFLALASPVMTVTAPLKIFLMAGQSNMSGRGGVQKSANGTLYWDGIVPPECEPNPLIIRLNVNLTWELAKEPIHEGIDRKKTKGVGPGMSFANQVLKLKPSYGKIGLVPCAHGGSAISRWQRGTALYDRMLLRANASIQSGGMIKALIWQQGGSDSMEFADAMAYKSKLSKFFKDIRQDLNSPQLTILQVAIAPGKNTYTGIVREDQFSMDNEDPNVHTVDSAGLPVGFDNIHLTTEGQIQLGKILAWRFLETKHRKISRVEKLTTSSLDRISIPHIISKNLQN